MKQFLLASFFIAILASAAQAQLTISPEVSTNNFEGLVLTNSTDLEIHVAVTNTTNDTLKLRWVRRYPAALPTGWTTLVCDNNNCYAAHTYSNILPGLNVPFVLDPGETLGNFLLHLKPTTTAGCSTVEIDFYDLKDTSQVIATLKYELSVNTPGCFSTGTEETSQLALRIFPNPATDFFTVSDNSKVKFITVTNLLGKRVRSFNFQTGDRYNISDLPDGMYLVSMKDGKNNILKTQRLSKRSARP